MGFLLHTVILAKRNNPENKKFIEKIRLYFNIIPGIQYNISVKSFIFV
jgi:hypothetical protein